MTTLDITDWKETGDELKKAINQAVKDTQRVLIRPYPHILVMTVKQYQDLQHDPELQLMYKSEDHLYRTPYCVLEVRVKH